MTTEYEFEGKTKADALAKACKELNLDEDQLKVEVVSYGSTGIFGLVGVKKAKIKVTVPTVQGTEDVETVYVESDVPSSETASRDDIVENAKEILEKMVSFIVDDAVVVAEENSDRMKLTVEGGNSALLIGKHGRTLDALQYIVQKAVQKQTASRARVTVDVEGYRERRKASLTQLALRLGEKVKRSGRPATINPMNAYDRRIVHVALKDETKVRTQSMGSGALRKLVIYPQRENVSRRRNSSGVRNEE